MSAARCSMAGVYRREHGGDRDRPDPLLENVARRVPQLPLIKRRDLPAVEFVAAMREIAVEAQRRAKVLGPVDHRREAFGRRQAKSERGDLEEALALHNGIREMRGADHQGLDLAVGGPPVLQDRFERADNSAADIGRGLRLVPAQDLESVHQDGVGIGSTDIDTDMHVLGVLRFPLALSPTGFRLRRRARQRPRPGLR